MTDDAIAQTPEPPYCAVIFTARRTPDDDAGYAAMAAEMDALAREQPGYLGIESARNAEGVGITVSYWSTEADVRGWKAVTRHRDAQRKGREAWYQRYSVRVAKVERAYAWDSDTEDQREAKD